MRWMLLALLAFVFAACAGGGGSKGGGNGGSSGNPPGPATALAMLTQPAGATAGNIFATQPRVEIRDAAGVRVNTDNTTQVTAAITTGTGTGGALLSGTAAVTAVNGVVTFTNLSIDLVGTGYTLTFTASGLSDAVSAAFAVTAASAGGGKAPFVPAVPGGAATHYVSTTGSDSNNGTSPATAWLTLQHAATQAQPGNVIEVADGSYARFTIQNKTATSGNPIILRAAGNAVVINSGTSSSTSPDNRDAIKVYNCHHVTIHGIRTANAFRAGCRVTESFHVRVQGCVFANGGTWGLFTDFSDDLVLEGNECYGSQREHGIYFSNSGDRAIIRGNYCHNNAAGGIQINADPAQQNAAFGTRGDGISEQCVIERNWCVDNGGGSAAVPGASPAVAGGGASLNFASIRNCDVRNNLLITQYNQSGIVLWDDGFSSSYGSMNNRVYHNTVIFAAGVTRHCVVMRNGSTGNDIRNNVFYAGARGIFEVTTNSMSGLTEGYNVTYKPSGWAYATDEATSTSYSTLANWQTFSGQGGNNDTGLPQFTNTGADDYSLQTGSPGRDDGVGTLGVTGTYDGASRPQGAGYDRGCFEK